MNIREAARRRTREIASADNQAVTSPNQALEQQEPIQAVVDALIGLRELYRTTVLKRFYENRKPAEIALEMGVPVEIVCTRLKRALAELRLKLTAHAGGDRRRLSFGLIGLFRLDAASKPLITGVFTMGITVKVG